MADPQWHHHVAEDCLLSAVSALKEADDVDPTYRAAVLIQLAEAWAAIGHVHALLAQVQE